MSSPLIYTYPPLEAGILVRRYKRFFAEIELTSGEVITAHCPNTGPMTDVCTVGSPVQVSRSNNPKRKLAYTWEMIQVPHPEPTWVGVNTGLPNRVMRSLLEQKQLPELAPRYDTVQREVVYGTQGKSRVDFLLTSSTHHPPLYLEVKNVTWTQGKIAVFPDTVTTRGQKHLGDLMGVLGEAKAAIVYFINRGDCEQFAPGDSTDPKYGELLRQAYHQGVEVYPYRFKVTPQGLYLLGLAEFLLSKPSRELTE